MTLENGCPFTTRYCKLVHDPSDKWGVDELDLFYHLDLCHIVLVRKIVTRCVYCIGLLNYSLEPHKVDEATNFFLI